MSDQSRDMTLLNTFGQDTCNFQPPPMGTTLRMQDVSACSNAETIGKADTRVAGLVRATTIVAITTAFSFLEPSKEFNSNAVMPRTLVFPQQHHIAIRTS